jgi:hypothetical protein
LRIQVGSPFVPGFAPGTLYAAWFTAGAGAGSIRVEVGTTNAGDEVSMASCAGTSLTGGRGSTVAAATGVAGAVSDPRDGRAAVIAWDAEISGAAGATFVAAGAFASCTDGGGGTTEGVFAIAAGFSSGIAVAARFGSAGFGRSGGVAGAAARSGFASVIRSAAAFSDPALSETTGTGVAIAMAGLAGGGFCGAAANVGGLPVITVVVVTVGLVTVLAGLAGFGATGTAAAATLGAGATGSIFTTRDATP